MSLCLSAFKRSLPAAAFVVAFTFITLPDMNVRDNMVLCELQCFTEEISGNLSDFLLLLALLNCVNIPSLFFVMG